jgi:hypothetical protein
MAIKIRRLAAPNIETFDRLWAHSGPIIDPDPDKLHPEYFLGAVGAEAKRQHVLSTFDYWLERPGGFLLEFAIDELPVMWIAGEQQEHLLVCYLALLGPGLNGTINWIHTRAVYTAFREWFLQQPTITTLRSHSTGSGPVYDIITRMFDRRWNIAGVRHPVQSQITAYQDAADQVVTFDYKWQDLDWKFR